MSRIGIYLNNVGVTSLPTYDEIALGRPDDRDNENVFDFLRYGIYAENSNFSSYANIFANIQDSNATGTGGNAIYATADPGTISARAQVWMNPSGSVNNIYHNHFYAIDRDAVEINNYYEIRCSDNVMLGNYDVSNIAGSLAATENYACNIHTWKSNTIEVEHNHIVNMVDGIKVTQTNDGSGHQFIGDVNILSDTINAVPNGSSFNILAGGYINNGIRVDNPIVASTTASGGIAVKNNILNDVFDGIYATYIGKQVITDKYNTIGVQDGASTITDFYGIKHDNCSADLIEVNTVNGANTNIANNTAHSWGMWLVNASGSVVECNTTVDIGNHIQFDNGAGNLLWKWNRMVNNSNVENGMVLNGGSIGTQQTGGLYSANSWEHFWTAVGAYTLTVTTGTTATSSTLNVLHNTSVYDPTVGNLGGGTYAYSFSNGLVNPGGAFPSSPCGSLKGNPSSVIQVNNIKNAYSVFPNPGDGHIYLRQQNATDERLSIEVFDAVGKLVYKGSISFSNGQAELDIADITCAGIYMLQLKDGKGVNYIEKYVRN